MSGPRPETLALLDRLVGFDTVSRGSNLALIDHVGGEFERHGIAARVIPSADGTKADLYATIGPEIPGGVVFSGHSDVVPVDGQPWTSDPFTLTPRDGRLYGRGSADMKGFIACAVALAPEFKRRKLKRPLHVCLTFDEETTCAGAATLVREIGRSLPRPAIAIIGEPTSMRVANAHKGVCVLCTRVTAKEAHSSFATARVPNAIMTGGRVLDVIADLQARLEARGLADAPPGVEFEPASSTVSVGAIAGGSAHNIIARDCVITWQFRAVPGASSDQILAEFERAVAPLDRALRDAIPEGGIRTETVTRIDPLTPERDGPAEKLALSLTGGNRAVTVAFGSEAGFFQAAGISTVLCGPGDIAQAHQADEFVAVDQLAACEAFLLKIADWASA